MAFHRRTVGSNCLLRRLTALSLLVASVQSLQCSSSAKALSSRMMMSRHASRRDVAASGRGAVSSYKAVPEGNSGCNIRKLSLCNNRPRRRPFVLVMHASTGDDVETDAEIDEFLEDLFEDSVAASNSTDGSDSESEGEEVPSHFIQGKTAVGIGGNDGFVYDVNSLKRNLVQESVRGSKRELLLLLGDGRHHESIKNKEAKEDGNDKVSATPRWRRDRDDLIEERLAALVQTNPVSTTTDSNLLDGEWSFAFATNSASTILDTSRFLLSKTKRTNPPVDEMRTSDNEGNIPSTARGGPWRFRAGKTENPFRTSTREIYLENLSGDENAHIMDETRVLGGLFQISRRYDVFGLTRTALDLDLMESESRLFGLRVNSSNRDDFRGTKLGNPLEIQVLYLDTDLCICTTGAGLDGPLHVYTKSDLWVTGGTKRKMRLMAKTASWVSTMQSPLRLRQRLMNVFAKKNDNQVIPGPGLKSVNIGELDINMDGTTREEPAWDGADDPFMHLSPGERMEVLKTMSLQDIYQSGMERKQQNKKQKNKWSWKRDKKFKGPDL